MSAPASLEVHHEIPRCLLRLFDAAGEGLVPWGDFDAEARRWGVEPREVRTREELAVLVDGSTVEIPRDEHREGHADDFARWGRRGGLETFARYGAAWFATLARRRWGKIGADELSAAFAACGGRS